MTPQQKAKRIQIALGIIALSGISLSLYAHISHLSPRVKYFGNFLTFSAFASWLILQVQSPNRSNIKKNDEANPSTLIPSPAEQMDPSPYIAVPEAIHSNIGKYLTPSDLLKLCQVSKKFSSIYSSDPIWKERFKEEQPAPEGQLCLQTMQAQENTGGPSQPASTDTTNNNASIPHSSWKEAYRLRNRIRHCKIEKIHIPKENEPRWVRACWMTHNKVCLAYEYNFEIWDARLNHRLLQERVKALFKPRITQLDNIIFYTGYNRLYNKTYDIHVYRFNIDKLETFKPMKFLQGHRNVPDFIPPIVLNMHKAFIGHKDGVIGVWDLEKEMCHPQCRDFEYNDETAWNEQLEQRWKATFQNEDVAQGERDRFYLEPSREYQKVLNNRKFLKGHTLEITALKLSGDYLFSSSKDGTIKQWDLSTYQCTHSFSSEFSEGARALWIEGPSIFGESNYIFKQWELSSKNCLLTIDGERPCAYFQIIENLLFCAYEDDEDDSSQQVIVETYHLHTQSFLGALSVKADSLDSMQIVNPQCLAISTHDTLFTWDFSRKQDTHKLEEAKKKAKKEQPNFFRRVLNQFYRPFSH